MIRNIECIQNKNSITDTSFCTFITALLYNIFLNRNLLFGISVKLEHLCNLHKARVASLGMLNCMQCYFRFEKKTKSHLQNGDINGM